MKRITSLIFLFWVGIAVCSSEAHITPTPATSTAAPTSVSNEALDLLLSMVKHEPPVRLESGLWGFLEPDEGTFVWRGNYVASEMRLRWVIAAWIAAKEMDQCDIGVRFGPAWSKDGVPGPDSYFGLYIRVGDEEVFFRMLLIQPPYLQDC